MTLEEKQQRLDDIISAYLGALSQTTELDLARHSLSLVARSPESPVAKALAHRMADIKARRVTLRVIFAIAEPEAAMELWLDAAVDVRLARDPRLREAHEQLVLGRLACWLGDSMRREADKLDLFERYSPDCPRTHERAARAFDKIGAASVGVQRRRITASLNRVGQPGLADLVDATAAQQTGESGPAGPDLTRH